MDAAIPPNARIDTLLFDDSSRSLRVTLRGETTERAVQVETIAGLFGAQIRHESTSTVPPAKGGIDFGKSALMSVATGLPIASRKVDPKQAPSKSEELHVCLALRVAGVAELWYLLATSFNFRKALGPDATYSGEMNLKLFVKRLAGFAPRAPQDAFFSALASGASLPPPVDSLLEFFRTAAA